MKADFIISVSHGDNMNFVCENNSFKTNTIKRETDYSMNAVFTREDEVTL